MFISRTYNWSNIMKGKFHLVCLCPVGSELEGTAVQFGTYRAVYLLDDLILSFKFVKWKTSTLKLEVDLLFPKLDLFQIFTHLTGTRKWLKILFYVRTYS